MMFEQDEPEELSLTIEEIGGFEQNEENSTATDHGWKDELNLAEFPIAARRIGSRTVRRRSFSKTNWSVATTPRLSVG